MAGRCVGRAACSLPCLVHLGALVQGRDCWGEESIREATCPCPDGRGDLSQGTCLGPHVVPALGLGTAGDARVLRTPDQYAVDL